MKSDNHKLSLLTNDDYRENVLKSEVGKESAQDIIDDCKNIPIHKKLVEEIREAEFISKYKEDKK